MPKNRDTLPQRNRARIGALAPLFAFGAAAPMSTGGFFQISDPVTGRIQRRIADRRDVFDAAWQDVVETMQQVTLESAYRRIAEQVDELRDSNAD